jgi:hypothetical protein
MGAWQVAEKGQSADTHPPNGYPAPGTHRDDGCGALHLDLLEQSGQKHVLQQRDEAKNQ